MAGCIYLDSIVGLGSCRLLDRRTQHIKKSIRKKQRDEIKHAIYTLKRLRSGTSSFHPEQNYKFKKKDNSNWS